MPVWPKLGWHGSVPFWDLRSLHMALERLCSLDSSPDTGEAVAMKTAVMNFYFNL